MIIAGVKGGIVPPCCGLETAAHQAFSFKLK
ncbi:MAG: hypothetical protein HW380_2751 [Magnetococcales bacterium]|nr:hypothetical protein [Magnetococcales bacterium]